MATTKRTHVWWRTPALIITSAILIAVGILMYAKVRPAPNMSDNTTCLNSSSTDYQCMQQHYQYVVAKQGPEAAFVSLKQQYETNEFQRAQCHQMTHVIGRAAAKRYPNLSDAYTHGDNFCSSGYYHGVMETIIEDVGKDNIVAKANSICQELRHKQPYSVYHHNCAHGMGHGFMEVEDDELFQALQDCDVLTDTYEQTSCHGGVFMENIMATISSDKKTAYIKADDPLYPCDAVANKYKEPCYLMQTSHILRTNGYDFVATFAACASVSAPFDAICYQSLGRDASGQSIADGSKTQVICNKGSTEFSKSNCITGAVKDIIYYYHSDVQGKAFCNLYSGALRQDCLSVVESYYQTFK